MVKAQDQYMQEVRSKWHLQLTFQLKVIQSKSLVTSCWKKLLLSLKEQELLSKKSIGVTTANTWQELSFDFTG
jgi:hypothetical protein